MCFCDSFTVCFRIVHHSLSCPQETMINKTAIKAASQCTRTLAHARNLDAKRTGEGHAAKRLHICRAPPKPGRLVGMKTYPQVPSSSGPVFLSYDCNSKSSQTAKTLSCSSTTQMSPVVELPGCISTGDLRENGSLVSPAPRSPCILAGYKHLGMRESLCS